MSSPSNISLCNLIFKPVCFTPLTRTQICLPDTNVLCERYLEQFRPCQLSFRLSARIFYGCNQDIKTSSTFDSFYLLGLNLPGQCRYAFLSPSLSLHSLCPSGGLITPAQPGIFPLFLISFTFSLKLGNSGAVGAGEKNADRS